MTERHRRLTAEIAARRPDWNPDAIRVSVACFIEGNGYSDSDIVAAALSGHEPASAGARMARNDSDGGQKGTAGSLVSVGRDIGPPGGKAHHGPS